MNSSTNKVEEYHDISIWVNKYEDLFCTYDSSDYKDRTLSDNFLLEVHKLVRNLSAQNIRLTFNLMEDQCKPETEALIIQNLSGYFIARAQEAQNTIKQTFGLGCLLAVAGLLLTVSFFWLGAAAETVTFLHALLLMLEPLAWFLTWTGLDMIFVQSKNERPTVAFNLKMAAAELTFLSFGMPVQVDCQDASIAMAS